MAIKRVYKYDICHDEFPVEVLKGVKLKCQRCASWFVIDLDCDDGSDLCPACQSEDERSPYGEVE